MSEEPYVRLMPLSTHHMPRCGWAVGIFERHIAHAKVSGRDVLVHILLPGSGVFALSRVGVAVLHLGPYVAHCL